MLRQLDDRELKDVGIDQHRIGDSLTDVAGHRCSEAGGLASAPRHADRTGGASYQASMQGRLRWLRGSGFGTD
jgi:hypothetical protein